MFAPMMDVYACVAAASFPALKRTAYHAGMSDTLHDTHAPLYICAMALTVIARAAAQATAALLHCAAAWLLSGCHASGEVRHAGPADSGSMPAAPSRAELHSRRTNSTAA